MSFQRFLQHLYILVLCGVWQKSPGVGHLVYQAFLPGCASTAREYIQSALQPRKGNKDKQKDWRNHQPREKEANRKQNDQEKFKHGLFQKKHLKIHYALAQQNQGKSHRNTSQLQSRWDGRQNNCHRKFGGNLLRRSYEAVAMAVIP
jgi:hypothetical protein